MPEAQTQSFDLAVIGGGVIGLAVAWRAGRRGLRAVVLDRGDPVAAASRAAAGMLAPVTEAEFGEEALLELNLASAARYPEWVAELAEESGMDPGYRRAGTLLVARDADEAEALERLLAFRACMGLGVERLRPSEARRLEPGLAPTIRLALHAPDDHAVDPRALVPALAAGVRATGGEIRAGAAAAGVVVEGERVTGVRLADGSRIATGRTVVAAGCWSGELDGLPEDARVPVRPVKGQIMRLHDPAGPGLAGRILRAEGCYLVPRGDGRYVLGATVEERGFDTAATAGAVFELLREAVELIPGIAELELDEVAAGLRPGTPDNAPAIGPGALEGLTWATGHYRNGILLAPVTADAVAECLAGGELPDVVKPFAPGRFAAEVTA